MNRPSAAQEQGEGSSTNMGDPLRAYRDLALPAGLKPSFKAKADQEVWYHYAMRGPVNRFLAYLLLLFLPVQSQAVVAVLACYTDMKHTVVVERAMEGCQDAATMQQTISDAGIPDTKPHPESSDASHFSPCGMSSSCLTLASIAVVPDTLTVLIDSAMQLLAYTDEFYLSYISEGLERPPRLIRAYPED